MSYEAPLPFPGRPPNRDATAKDNLSGDNATRDRTVADIVAFDRRELSDILRLYGLMVAAGEWRDYAISHGREMAVFAVFRRTAETPLYRIEKRPKLRLKQGQYSVTTEVGQILRRGHDLSAVLKVLEKKLIRPVD